MFLRTDGADSPIVRMRMRPGLGLSNLVAEIETRLTGSAQTRTLTASLASAIPDAPTYVLILFDGLGAHQLDHPAASTLAEHMAGVIEAPFPTTTTVSLATIVTGASPASHGVIGHLLWLEEHGEVVNTLKWVTLEGRRLEVDTSGFLPQPNLWERLARAGVEPVTVQPADFAGSPLTRALYRGCRFEPIYDVADWVDATVTLASTRGRLVLAYLPHVDFAAHVWGQDSSEYAEALRLTDTAWSRLVARLPEEAVVIGTADHGLIDYPEEGKILIRDPGYADLTFYGDPRAVYVRGERDLIASLAEETGAVLLDRDRLLELLGNGPAHPALVRRLPGACLLAPDGKLLLPRGFDKRLVGYHGGLDRREVEIPLLVGYR